MKTASAFFLLIFCLVSCGMPESERHARAVIIQSRDETDSLFFPVSDDSLMQLLNTDEAVDAASVRSGLIKTDVATCRTKLRILRDSTGGGIAIEFYDPEEKIAVAYVDSLIEYVKRVRIAQKRSAIEKSKNILQERTGYKTEMIKIYRDSLFAITQRNAYIQGESQRIEQTLLEQEKEFVEMNERKKNLELALQKINAGILRVSKTNYIH